MGCYFALSLKFISIMHSNLWACHLPHCLYSFVEGEPIVE